MAKSKVYLLLEKSIDINTSFCESIYLGIQALDSDPEEGGEIRERDILENGIIEDFRDGSMSMSDLKNFILQGNKFALKVLVTLIREDHEGALDIVLELQDELPDDSPILDVIEQAFATEDDNTEDSSTTAFLVGALVIAAAEVGDCG